MTPLETLNHVLSTYQQFLDYYYGFKGGTVPEDAGAGDNKTLTAHHRFTSISIELHETPAGKVWICLPRKGTNTYLWYALGGDPPHTALPHPKLLSTPYPWWGEHFALQNSGDFNGHDAYGIWEGFAAGADPPHWTPILALDGPVTWTTGKTLHDFNFSDPGSAHALITSIKSSLGDLTDRAMKLWAPAVVRGHAIEAGFPSGDYAGDHTTDYNDGADAPTGGWSEATDPSWDGMDWDVNLDVDQDCVWLSAQQSRTGQVRVEIEHFALPGPYRPQKGDWIQATGRWVTDNGSDHVDEPNYDAYTEIHPPALIVSTRPAGSTGVTSRVIATGAWLGEPLTFVVFPPPRPAGVDHLNYTVDSKLVKDANLTVTPWPPDNPNHLVGRITSTAKHPVIRYNSGAVGMTGDRGLQAMISAWWAVPSCQVEVVASSALQRAKGIHLCYRERDDVFGIWQVAWFDENGRCALSSFLPKAYLFRPAGSGVDFTKVPREVNLNVGQNKINFAGVPRSYPAASPFAHIVAGTLSRFRLGPLRQILADSQLEYAALQVLDGELFTLAYAKPPLGVHGNTMGLGYYQDKFNMSVNLASVVNKDGTPVDSLSSIIKSPHTTTGGAEWFPHVQTPDGLGVFISAMRGPGVPNAKVQALLIVGNARSGFHVVGEQTRATDASGTATFTVEAGTRSEDVHVQVHVVENPVNTWFKPKAATDLAFVAPGTSDDSGPFTAYRFSLEPTDLQNAAVLALNDEVRGKQRTAASMRRFIQTARPGAPRPRPEQVADNRTEIADAQILKLIGP